MNDSPTASPDSSMNARLTKSGTWSGPLGEWYIPRMPSSLPGPINTAIESPRASTVVLPVGADAIGCQAETSEKSVIECSCPPLDRVPRVCSVNVAGLPRGETGGS